MSGRSRGVGSEGAAGRRRGSLAEGHCCIVPAEHVASARRCEDGVATEMRNFKKSLLQMFMARVWSPQPCQ